jgi:hypothetical protein
MRSESIKPSQRCDVSCISLPVVTAVLFGLENVIMKILPINLDDLIHARSVESVRREFKSPGRIRLLASDPDNMCVRE